jgi:hypothetical protein
VDDCGCVRYDARRNREDQQRTWLVSVEFFEKNRWMPAVEVRVKAHGAGGAAMKAVRQAKHERQSRRRILQTRVVMVPVPRGPATASDTERRVGSDISV